MPNVAAILKKEISRVAHRELRRFFKELTPAVSILKKTVSAQKKKITQLEAKVAKLEKRTGADSVIKLPKGEEFDKSRLGSKNIAKLRAKLNLTRVEMAKLIGVNPNSIFLWENAKATPRSTAKAKIIALRGVGKREIKKILEGLDKKEAAPAAEVKTETKKEKKPRKAKTPAVTAPAIAPVQEGLKPVKKPGAKKKATPKKNALKKVQEKTAEVKPVEVEPKTSE